MLLLNWAKLVGEQEWVLCAVGEAMGVASVLVAVPPQLPMSTSLKLRSRNMCSWMCVWAWVWMWVSMSAAWGEADAVGDAERDMEQDTLLAAGGDCDGDGSGEGEMGERSYDGGRQSGGGVSMCRGRGRGRWGGRDGRGAVLMSCIACAIGMVTVGTSFGPKARCRITGVIFDDDDAKHTPTERERDQSPHAPT